MNKAAGAALALAMSHGHPDPDRVLMEIVDEGLALAPKLAVLVREGVEVRSAGRGVVFTDDELALVSRCVNVVFKRGSIDGGEAVASSTKAGVFDGVLAKLKEAGQ